MLKPKRAPTFVAPYVLVAFCMIVLSVAGKLSFASDAVTCPKIEDKELDHFFSQEVWPKVGRAECVKCHKTGGDADDTRFVLQDLSRLPLKPTCL